MLKRLLVCDLDGTLLNCAGEISAAQVRALRQLQADGQTGVTLATGRSIASTLPYAAMLGLSLPLITVNGAQIAAGRSSRLLRERSLTKAELAIALPLLEAIDLQVVAYVDSFVCCRQLTPRLEQYLLPENPVLQVGDLHRFLQQTPRPVTKLMGVAAPGQPIALPWGWETHPLHPSVRPLLNLVQSEPYALEVLPAGVSKGEALHWLTGHLGLPLEATLAIGNADNDWEMITSAGIGIAVGNASPTLQAVADWIAPDSDHDPVLAVLQRYGLSATGPRPLDSPATRLIEDVYRLAGTRTSA